MPEVNQNSYELAIAILNFNGKTLLEEFLPLVVEFSLEASIYVIDNASSDDSVSYVRKFFPSVKVIQLEKNYGYAKGYNKAISQIKQEFVCFLNSDIQVTKNWLSPILELFQQDPKIVAIQPKILDYNKKTHFEYAGAAGGFINFLGFPYCRGRNFFKIEQDKGQYDDTSEIFWASGACLFVRKSVFVATQGFDDDFFAHMEEIDWCWRVNKLGYKVVYTSDSVVYHVGGASLHKTSPQKTYLNFRNNLWMMTKNLPIVSLFPIVFLRMLVDGLLAIYLLLTRGFLHFLAVPKAHFSFYKGFIKMYKKRPK